MGKQECRSHELPGFEPAFARSTPSHGFGFGLASEFMSAGDVVTFEDGTVVEYGPRLRPLLHVAAPLVTAAAIWAARQAIDRTYKGLTGRTPPTPRDPQTSWARAIVWTAATATTAALTEVAVHRLADERAIRILRRGRRSVARRRE